MPNQRVMILGTSGSLGGYLAHALSPAFQVISPRPRSQKNARSKFQSIEWIECSLEATDAATIGPLLTKARPDVVINCIAVTPQSEAYVQGEDICRLVNTAFPHHLADQCRKQDVYLVHIGTDGVFSGTKGNYRETNSPDPVDLYGETKLAGEVSEAGCITLRTTFFGVTPRRASLLDWFLTKQGETVEGYVNYHFSGLWLGTLAVAIESLLNLETRHSGVFHVGGETISKYQLMHRLNERLSLEINLLPKAQPECDRSLDSTKFWTALDSDRPSFESMLEAMLPELETAAVLDRACLT